MDISYYLQKEKLNKEDIVFLLGRTEPDELEQLYRAAYEMKKEWVGNVDYYRGLLEFSNRCIKNCCYCGIRRGNRQVERFDTPKEDILAMARWCYEQQYGSITLQSGERQDVAFIDFVDFLQAEPAYSAVGSKSDESYPGGGPSKGRIVHQDQGPVKGPAHIQLDYVDPELHRGFYRFQRIFRSVSPYAAVRRHKHTPVFRIQKAPADCLAAVLRETGKLRQEECKQGKHTE